MTKFKEAMLCIIKFFLLLAYAIGIIGGILNAISSTAWPLAVCVLILGVFGWPTAKKLFAEIRAYNAVETNNKNTK